MALMHRPLVTLLAGCVLLAGCAALGTAAGSRAEVSAAHAKLVAAYNDCNTADFTASYAETFTFTTSNTPSAYTTLPALRGYLAVGCRQTPRPRVTLKAESVHFAGPLALVTGQYVFRVASRGGTTDLTQNFTAALRFEAGAWRVTAHHVSVAP